MTSTTIHMLKLAANSTVSLTESNQKGPCTAQFSHTVPWAPNGPKKSITVTGIIYFLMLC